MPAVIVVCVMAARIWMDYSNEGVFTASSIGSALIVLVFMGVVFYWIVWRLTRQKP